MDQRILPGLEPLDTRQAVSQRLEGLEGDSQDLQWGLEPKAAVDGPPSVLVAGPVCFRTAGFLLPDHCGLNVN